MVQNTNGKTRFTALVDEFDKMTPEELERINEILIGMMNQKRKMENIKLASSMRIGQKVRLKEQYQSRKPYDAEGTVKKVNPSKVVVAFDDTAGLWNVTPSMLDLIEGTSKK